MFSFLSRRPARSIRRRSLPYLEVLEDRTAPAVLLVNTLADTNNPTDPNLSLRAAIDAVNRGNLSQLSPTAQQQVDTTQDPLGVNDTIKFQVTGAIGLSGTLSLSRDVTIQGPGSTSLTVSGQHSCTVFVVDANAHVALIDLTIADGNSVGNGGGIWNHGTLTMTNCSLSGNSADGGGIYNLGTVTMTNCSLSGNSAGNGGGIYNLGTVTMTNCSLSGKSASYLGGGGGIWNRGTVTMTNSYLSGNSATYDGGGIYNLGTLTMTNSDLSANSAGYGGGIYVTGGTATMTDCSLSDNSAIYDGGGIWNAGTLTMTSSTLFGNSATYDGGGIWNRGTLTMTSSTLFGNSAVVSGGIWNRGTVTMTNCTLSGNSADGGGGIFNFGTVTMTNSTLFGNSAVIGGGIFNDGGTMTLYNSIVAGSVSGGDISNRGVLQGSHNLVQDGSGLSDWLSGDPGLGPLQDNGGPTWTHALLPGSVAIDAGDNALVPAGITTDQRGRDRFFRGIIDLGAFEDQTVPLAPTEPTAPTAPTEPTGPTEPTMPTVPTAPADQGPAAPLAPHAEAAVNSLAVDALMGQLNAVETVRLPSLPGAASARDLAFLPPYVAPAGARLTPVDLGGGDQDMLADQGGTDLSTLTEVQGTVFGDGNGDAVRSDGEQALGGQVVRLVQATGAVVAETTTGPEGEYRFDGVPAGQYRVEVEGCSGWAGAVSPALTVGSEPVTAEPLGLPPAEQAPEEDALPADEGAPSGEEPASFEVKAAVWVLLGAALPAFRSQRERRSAKAAARRWAD